MKYNITDPPIVHSNLSVVVGGPADRQTHLRFSLKKHPNFCFLVGVNPTPLCIHYQLKEGEALQRLCLLSSLVLHDKCLFTGVILLFVTFLPVSPLYFTFWCLIISVWNCVLVTSQLIFVLGISVLSFICYDSLIYNYCV